MKTTIKALVFIATMAFAGMAMATTWTVHDDADFWFKSSGASYSKTLDLATAGFTSADTITSAQLLLQFFGIGKVNQVVLNGVADNTKHIVFSLDKHLPYDVASILSNGALDLSVTGQGIFGAMMLTDVTLTANGSQHTNGSAVPEPGTIMLLGAGFLGLAICGKRRQKS